MKISIVTISYNQAEYLQQCIDSVVSQDIDGLQYIVVDPGSTDNSDEIIKSNKNFISVYLDEPDDGPADGLNNGFAMAEGEIYGYINADDAFAPGALKFVVDFFEARPNVDVLCGAIRIIDSRGRPSLRKRTSDKFNIADYMAGICTIGQQATFFRRKAFEAAGGFNENNKITWDGELLVDLALSGNVFETVFKVLGDFRVYPESITGSNKFINKQREEFNRIKMELLENKVELYSDSTLPLHRLLYKLNLLRHIKYLMVS